MNSLALRGDSENPMPADEEDFPGIHCKIDSQSPAAAAGAAAARFRVNLPRLPQRVPESGTGDILFMSIDIRGQHQQWSRAADPPALSGTEWLA